MALMSMYRIHRWLAVTAGAFLLVWLITGVIMLLPPLSRGPEAVRQAPTIAFRDIKLSPAQAVAILERDLGASPNVNSVGLRRIQDLIVYEIRLRDGSSHLINAVSGRLFTITREMAERYVMQMYPKEGRPLKVVTVEQYSYTYQDGPLPVYRVVLDAKPSVDFFVSPVDGSVRRSDRVNRFRGTLERFHTFDPLKLIVKSERWLHGVMIVAGVIAIGAMVTGYFLAFALARR
jgi:hypothetical protein